MEEVSFFFKFWNWISLHYHPLPNCNIFAKLRPSVFMWSPWVFITYLEKVAAIIWVLLTSRKIWRSNKLFVGIKAKGWILKQVFQENKARQVFRKHEHFLPPDTHTHVYVSGVKKFPFFGKFDVFCFLEAPVLRYQRLSKQKIWMPKLKEKLMLASNLTIHHWFKLVRLLYEANTGEKWLKRAIWRRI